MGCTCANQNGPIAMQAASAAESVDLLTTSQARFAVRQWTVSLLLGYPELFYLWNSRLRENFTCKPESSLGLSLLPTPVCVKVDGT